MSNDYGANGGRSHRHLEPIRIDRTAARVKKRRRDTLHREEDGCRLLDGRPHAALVCAIMEQAVSDYAWCIANNLITNGADVVGCECYKQRRNLHRQQLHPREVITTCRGDFDTFGRLGRLVNLPLDSGAAWAAIRKHGGHAQPCSS